MKTLPQPPSANERALGQEWRDQFTGLTGTTVTLSYTPMQTQNGVGLEMLYKNGALLTPGTDYTIAGATVTLGAALIAGDKIVCRYPYRS